MSGNASILLADDEVSILMTLELLLQQEGYEVTAARSAAEALEVLKKTTFHALILDLSMEREDSGLEVARAALKLKPRPAVMIYTGYPNLENSRIALELHVDYFAIKPIDHDALISALKKFTARVRAKRRRAAKGSG